MPSLPKDLINRILPKTPMIVLPVNPKVYFLNTIPVTLAPIIPISILANDINEAVKSLNV